MLRPSDPRRFILQTSLSALCNQEGAIKGMDDTTGLQTETMRWFYTGDQYLEIELPEEIKSALIKVHREVQWEEDREQQWFIETATRRLDRLGTLAARQEGILPYQGSHFERGVTAAKNARNIITTLYKWEVLGKYRPDPDEPGQVFSARLLDTDDKQFGLQLFPGRSGVSDCIFGTWGEW